MVKKLDGLPEQFMKAYPYKERPRSDDLYGVTEVLYCPRKTYLTRVVPAPTAIEFETRRRFSRGHAMEDVFFGDHHNPMYVKGDGPLAALEGHTDHAIQDKDGKIIEIVEFKSVKKLWFTAPNGKMYFSLKAAKRYLPEEDWKHVDRCYNDSHMDQLMTYMFVTGAKKGYLIYYEMSTDDNYTWEVDDTDISVEFKNKIIDRLNYIKYCFLKKVVPDRNTIYKWECMLCSFNKNGLCGICDKEGFELQKFIDDVLLAKTENFMEVAEKYAKKYSVTPGEVNVFGEKIEVDNGDTNGKDKE